MMTKREAVNGQRTLSTPNGLRSEGRCAAESRSVSEGTRGRSPSPQGAQAGARRLAFAFAFVAGLALGAGAAPVVGELTVKSVGDSYAEIEVPITDLGDGATSASVTLNYGEDAASLDKTYAPATSVTALGTTTLTLRRLLPECTYFVTATVTNDKDESVTSETAVSLTTTKTEDATGLPGLYQTYFASAHQAWTRDYTSYAEGTNWLDYAKGIYRRELGAIMAYFNTGDGCPRYVSELWGDQVYWPGSGGQWAYWGYMYFDAGKSYKLKCHMMDTFRIVVTHPTTGGQAFYFYGDAWQTAFTSDTFAPPVTGWYPIELRFSNGSGRAGGSKHDNTGAKYVENLGWSSDNGSTWDFLIDSGDGTLLRTGRGALITATERVASGNLTLDLSFVSSTSDRTLAVVWGPQHGGETTNGWAHAAVLGTVAAGDTSYSYPMPSTWGDDDCLVARFCFVSDDADPQWSNSTYWYDLSKPIFADVAADGSGGDTIKVTGKVESFTGASCDVKVLVGASSDSLAEWTGATTTLTAAGDFTFSLCETDTAAARYIAPGSTYYVQVEATANGKTARSEVVKVTTLGATKWKSSATSVSRKTVTFTGVLSDIGISSNGKAKVELWAGTANDESSLAKVEELEVAPCTTNALTAYSIAHTFANVETTYYWQFRVTNAAAGGTTNIVAKYPTSVSSVKTQDLTTYTWKGGDEGAWDAEANWDAGDYADDCLGCPQSANATARFTAAATISLASSRSVKSIDISGANVNVTIKKGATSTPTLTLAEAFAFSGEDRSLAFDGLTVKSTSTGSSSVGSGFSLVLTNGTSLTMASGSKLTNDGGRILLMEGTKFTGFNVYYMKNGSCTLMRDATFLMESNGQWVYWSNDGKTADTLQFEGTKPAFTFKANWFFFAPEKAGSVLNVNFDVPTSGYASAPLSCSSANRPMGAGVASGTAYVNVSAKRSVALQEGQTATPLISSPGNGISSSVFKAGTLPSNQSSFTTTSTTFGVNVSITPGFMLLIR